MTGPVTDPRFVSGLKNYDNEHAWTEFVKLYGPIAYRLAKKKGLSREDAEGVVQTFCIQVVKAIPDFHYNPERGRFRKWLLTVALNEIRRHFRDQAAAARRLREYQEQECPLADEQSGDENWWESAETSRILQLALEKLAARVPAEDMTVFRGLLLEGVSTEQISSRFGLNRNQIYGLKFRLLRKLREIAVRMREELDER